MARTLQIAHGVFLQSETLQSYDHDDLIAQHDHEMPMSFRKPQLRILSEGMRPRTCMAIGGWCSIQVFFPSCHETVDSCGKP